MEPGQDAAETVAIRPSLKRKDLTRFTWATADGESGSAIEAAADAQIRQDAAAGRLAKEDAEKGGVALLDGSFKKHKKSTKRKSKNNLKEFRTELIECVKEDDIDEVRTSDSSFCRRMPAEAHSRACCPAAAAAAAGLRSQ